MLAAKDAPSTEAVAALEQLCQTYWYPLYAYVRHRGHSPEDAQDLTQEFFHRLLKKDYLAQVDAGTGRFRSFLLAAMTHFLSNERDRVRTIKRGGKLTFLPLEESRLEQRYQNGLPTAHSPEEISERAWVFALLDKVLARLRAETAASRQCARFEELKDVLMGEKPSAPYARLAAKLGTTEAALKMAVQRLRRRYVVLLREEIAITVPGPEDVEDELRHLRVVLSSMG